ncbi:MAG: AraC family transcriptional regulator [Clostridia bacterium]|nr:AraC family transcriptional regulator [Clostridia bacterium]
MSRQKIILNNFVRETFRSKVNVEERVTAGNEQPFLHWHPHYEIHIVLSGSYTVVSNEITIHADEPAVYLHAPYSLHSVNAAPDPLYHRYVVAVDRSVPAMFTPETMDMSIFTDTNFICAHPTPVELLALCDMVRQIQLHRDDTVTCALYAALLMRQITRILADGRGECRRSSFTYIQELLSSVGDHLTEPLTIKSLAQQYGVSESKLAGDFKSALGMTFKKYLTTLRMTRAREMLLAGESIIRTSLECGYSSEAHFVKSFREYWGTTPGEFIRQTKDSG